MKHELVELVGHIFGNWEVVSSNLGEPKLNFLFAKIFLWHEGERAREP